MDTPVSHEDFDERAATWDDDPAKVERARVVAEQVRASVPLGASTRLLEYGCGTALVSQALQDDVGPLTLADTSEGMLDQVRAKIAAGTLRDARAWQLDLSRDPVPDERFDVIVTVMTLHHIPELGSTLRGFARLLESGGHLCIVDLEQEDGSFHGAEFPGHRGFARDDLASQLRDTGFGEIEFQDAYEIVKENGNYGLFLATGRREA